MIMISNDSGDSEIDWDRSILANLIKSGMINNLVISTSMKFL